MSDIAYFLPVLYAFVGCLGFSVIYNLHGMQILWASLGGALGWFGYLLVLPMSNDLVSNFVAAMLVGIFSEVMARVHKKTVTSFLLIGIFPMVPGAGIYYTMRYCVLGDTQNFVTTGIHTFGVAASLAIGVFVVASTWRLMKTVMRKNALRR